MPADAGTGLNGIAPCNPLSSFGPRSTKQADPRDEPTAPNNGWEAMPWNVPSPFLFTPFRREFENESPFSA